MFLLQSLSFFGRGGGRWSLHTGGHCPAAGSTPLDGLIGVPSLREQIRSVGDIFQHLPAQTMNRVHVCVCKKWWWVAFNVAGGSHLSTLLFNAEHFDWDEEAHARIYFPHRRHRRTSTRHRLFCLLLFIMMSSQPRYCTHHQHGNYCFFFFSFSFCDWQVPEFNLTSLRFCLVSKPPGRPRTHFVV